MPWNGDLSGGTWQKMGCVDESRPGTSGRQPFETYAADGAWKTKREERQYKLRLRGLDEIWRDFVEYFKLINLQKISSWQQRNHSKRENRPKERNLFRTLNKKGDKMSFFSFTIVLEWQRKVIWNKYYKSELPASMPNLQYTGSVGDPATK